MSTETPAVRLRLATRGSGLALAQSRQVAEALERAHPGLVVELVTVTTSGDRIQDRPLHEMGGKGLFTKEIEQALLAGEAEAAVHSYKDVPVTMPLVAEAERELVIAAVPRREDVRDVLVTADGRGVGELEKGWRVGTTSRRRQEQLRELVAEGVEMVDLRGNVETRLRKVEEGELEAVVLAMAGLRRLGAFDGGRMRVIEVEEVVPAAGQGALAIQCRRSDEATLGLLAVLDEVRARRCVEVERRVVAGLEGDCTSPIGVWCDAQEAEGGGDEGRLRLTVVSFDASRGGRRRAREVLEVDSGLLGGGGAWEEAVAGLVERVVEVERGGSGGAVDAGSDAGSGVTGNRGGG